MTFKNRNLDKFGPLETEFLSLEAKILTKNGRNDKIRLQGDLLDEMIDGDQSAGSADTGATVGQNGSAVGAVIFVQTAQETKDSRRVFRSLEILPDEVVVLEHGTHLTLHHTQFRITRTIQFRS